MMIVLPQSWFNCIHHASLYVNLFFLRICILSIIMPIVFLVALHPHTQYIPSNNASSIRTLSNNVGSCDAPPPQTHGWPLVTIKNLW